MFFSQDWRERIKAENPDAGFGMRASFSAIRFELFALITNNLVPRVGEIGKLLGAKWKEMDDDDKKVRYWPNCAKPVRLIRNLVAIRRPSCR